MQSSSVRRSGQNNIGFRVPPEMRTLADTPGYLSGLDALKLRIWYYQEYERWNLTNASKLSRCCYDGNLEGVQTVFQSNPEQALPEIGYLFQVVLGAQRGYSTRDVHFKHKEVLQYLCELGCSVDQVDIAGYTAFFHSILHKPKFELAKVLLEHGANVNHKNKFGSTPIIEAIRNDNFQSVEFLLDHGADLDLCDADGVSGERLYRGSGAEIVAIVERWKRKRAGGEAPIKCAMCNVENSGRKFQSCGRCRLVHYCSKECQLGHWRDHMTTCYGSQEQEVIVVTRKPHYEDFVTYIPGTRMRDFLPQSIPFAENIVEAGNQRRERITSGTNMYLKIAVHGPIIFIVDRWQTFDCMVLERDNSERFTQLAKLIGEKGIPASAGGPGIKIYLLADLKNPDELVIKLGRVMAEKFF